MIDVLGYAAASAVLTSFLMRSIVRLAGFSAMLAEMPFKRWLNYQTRNLPRLEAKI